MDKITRMSLPALTIYYLTEYCKKFNCDYEELLELFLEQMNDQAATIYEEGYSEGQDDGDTEGYERGWAERDSEDEDDDNKTSGWNEKIYTQHELDSTRSDGYKMGYEDGYKTGIDWKPPKYEELRGL